ncbi:hypothetical protein PINS_up005969 [Pythium insidiosum]|nr:hypothetical protein PINS_up005969 [Pythium insidiosum]
MEGLGGQELRVEGLWHFELNTVYNQIVRLNAQLVSGCDEEILMRKDYLVDKRARIDFETNEARYMEGETQVILPFTVSNVVGRAAIRLARGQKLPTQAFATLKVPVTAPDGTVGVLEPTAEGKEWLLTPRTVATMRDGHVTVLVPSVMRRTTKLPARKQLGTGFQITPLLGLVWVDQAENGVGGTFG